MAVLPSKPYTPRISRAPCTRSFSGLFTVWPDGTVFQNKAFFFFLINSMFKDLGILVTLDQL